jgi:hypothetical protein
VIGEEAYWKFEQALAFAIHLNVEKVGETPPFFALADRSPEALKSLEALWSPKTFEALWALLRDLVAGKFHAIEHRQPVDRLQWLDREAHLRQHERLVAGIGIRQFVAEVKKVTRHTLTPVADFPAALPAPGEMEGTPKKPPAFSDMKAFCSNHAGAYRTVPEMDAALTARFGVRDRETLRAVRTAAGFKGAPKGRRPGSKNKPVQSPRRSK